MSSKLLQSLQKSGYATLIESSIINKKEPIKTNVPIINFALSGDFFGGLETGTTILAGPSSSFKTALMLYLMREFQRQKPNGVVVLVDSEGGTNPQMLKNFGIELDRVIYIPVKHIGEMHHSLQTILQEKISRDDDVLVAVDSLGNVATLGEIDRAISNKISSDVGNRAKELKSLFRTISPFIRNREVYSIFLNHTYDTPEMFSKRVMSGGSGPMYDAQTVIFLNKVKNPNSEHDGDNRFNMLVHKSRKVVDRSKFFVDVYQKRGIDPLSNLIDLAKDKDIGVLKFHSGQYWKLYDYDKTTGEIEETQVTKSQIESMEFWADTLKNNQLFNDMIRDRYAIQIEDNVVSDEVDIFSLMENIDNEDPKKAPKKDKESDKEKKDK